MSEAAEANGEQAFRLPEGKHSCVAAARAIYDALHLPSREAVAVLQGLRLPLL